MAEDRRARRRLRDGNHRARTRLEAGRRIFTRIVVGVDGSRQALEAARQAALLQDIDGQLTLLAAWDTAATIIGGTGSEIPVLLRRGSAADGAERALAAGARIHRSVHPRDDEARARRARRRPAHRNRPRRGHAGRRRQQRQRDASSASSRDPWPTEIIHRAPCSVLVARPGKAASLAASSPASTARVESAAAYAAARYLAERFDAALRTVVASGGKGVDERLVAVISGGEHDDSPLPPAEALTNAARDADLVVVGSRGLHGLRSLGSVSERVRTRRRLLDARRPRRQSGSASPSSSADRGAHDRRSSSGSRGLEADGSAKRRKRSAASYRTRRAGPGG